ncbi:MAG: hypothetical protein OXL96_03625 [Candidatus Poribacteria bacterium]|nr:hypothetical protein [Candidatus Poribacteria bacterium]
MKIVAIVMAVAVLLNAVAPTLAHSAIYLQGAKVNPDTLTQDAYVAVTYYDSKGQEKTEKGWIDEIDETTFTIRSGGLKSEKTIAYANVVSVIMSEESTVPAKQMNEVNGYIRTRNINEIKTAQATQQLRQKTVTVLSRGQIEPSKIMHGWYAHAIYTSKGAEVTTTGRITRQDSVHIVISVLEDRALNRFQEEKALKISQPIAYRDMDTLVISQSAQSIEAWRKLNKYDTYNTRVRIYVPSRSKWWWMVGEVVKMTPDTLVIRRGRKLLSVSRSAISKFEVSLRQYRHTGKGLMVGLALNALSWGSLASDDEATLAEGYGVIIMTPVLLIIPTFIGAMIKSDKWVEVPPQRLNLSVAPTSTKGLRAALTFNF